MNQANTRGVLTVVALLLAGACGDNTSASGGACDPSKDSCTFANDFGSQAIAAGAERANLCQSWTLNNPTELWVSTVEMKNGGAWHHSNWFFVPIDDFQHADGQWDCGEASFDEFTAAIVGGVVYAQSTQASDEIQAFPADSAVRIPPYSRIIGATHLLNASDTDLVTDMTLSFKTLPVTQVLHKLAPFHLDYHDLHLPAMSTTDFSSTCEVASVHQAVMGTPNDIKLVYLLPHYHKRGTDLQVKVVGGAHDGQKILDLIGFDQGPHGRPIDPPLDLSDSTGFEFGCDFHNETAQDLVWGIGENEMCELLGFADSSMAFQAEVFPGTSMVTGTATDGTILNSGPCKVQGFAYYQDKDGGHPPK